MEFVSPTPSTEETVMDYSLLGGSHAERGRKLYLTGLGLLIVAVLYLIYTANVDDFLHMCLGILIFVLAVVPCLIWARSGGGRFPVFETILVLCANAYAIPLLNAREQLAAYPTEVITKAGLAVVIYQISAILIYIGTKGVPGRSRFWRESIITRDIERLIVYGLISSTIYFWANTFTTWIPLELESILRAVFFGVSTLCTFVSTQRLGRGEMARHEKIVLFCTLIPQLILMSVGLLLIVPIGLIGIALLGYLSGGKRIPWLVIAGVFVLLAILHTGKTKMRTKYWDEKYPAPTITQLPTYFGEWIEYGLQPTSGEKSVGHKLIERSSLMHIMCLVVSITPEQQDYLYGKTYSYVLPQLIPRLFYPGKPRSHVATYELGVYYGLQDEEATNTTTIAFGLLTEAYANFGLLGSVLLGAFWGFGLKKLQVWSTFSPMFSLAGLSMVLLTAWSFNAELTMAAWVSSLEQALLVVLGAPMIIRGLFGL
jgi:hypothetical protein